MFRSTLIHEISKEFGFAQLSASEALSKSVDANTIDCDCYAPVWMHPYSKLEFSTPYLADGLIYNFYTDKSSSFGYSENEIAYCWLVQVDQINWEAFANSLIWLSLDYKKDLNPPDAITWIPESFKQQLQKIPAVNAELQFVKCKPEYVYETLSLVNYDAPGIRGRSRSGMRRYDRDAKYSIFTLQSFLRKNGVNFLLDFVNAWYSSKENVNNYPNFECMQVTLADLQHLQSYQNLDINGYVVLDDMKIIALSFCSKISKDSWAFLGRFTDQKYPYISDFITSITAELYTSLQFCHDGGAGGRQGLAEFKNRLLTPASSEHAEPYYAVLPLATKVDYSDYDYAGIHF